MKKIGLGIAAVFLLVLVSGFILSQLQGNASDQAEAGDCARITGAADSPKYQVKPCDANDATVKIAKVLPKDERNCPTGGTPYSTYTGSSTFCLMPNFAEGRCYGQNRESGIAKVDCGTPDSVRVTKVVNGKNDPAACGNARSAAFPDPAVTFCLERGDGR
jgi:hypothetical protein